MQEFISVNGFSPFSIIGEYQYYLEEYGEGHGFPPYCWTGYTPSNMRDSIEWLFDYLRIGGNLSWVETEFSVTLYDCDGEPVARLKKPGAILGRADNTDQELIAKIAEIYAQLSN